MLTTSISTLISMLNEISILESDKFKSIAYKRACFSLKALSNDEFQKRTSFSDLKSIGSGINKKILEYKETGNILKLDELRDLQKDFLDPALYKIRKGFISKRIPLTDALAMKAIFMTSFIELGIQKQVMFLGSLRRRKEYIADFDIVTIGDEAYEKVVNFFKNLEYEIEVSGDKKTTFICPNAEKTTIDVTKCSDEEKVFAALHFTGSKENNIAMRARAKKLGYQLNQYGMFDKDGNSLSFSNEQQVYEFLGMQYVEPWNR